MLNHDSTSPPKKSQAGDQLNKHNPLSTNTPNPSLTEDKNEKPVDQTSKKQAKKEKKSTKQSPDYDQDKSATKKSFKKSKKITSAKTKPYISSSSSSVSLSKIIKKAHKKAKKKHRGSNGNSQSTIDIFYDMLAGAGMIDYEEQARVRYKETFQNLCKIIVGFIVCALLIYVIIGLNATFRRKFMNENKNIQSKQMFQQKEKIQKQVNALNAYQETKKQAQNAIKKQNMEKNEADREQQIKDAENTALQKAAEKKQTAIEEFNKKVKEIRECFTPKVDSINNKIAASTPDKKFKPADEIQTLENEAKKEINDQFSNDVLQTAEKSKSTLYDEIFGDLFKKLPPRVIEITDSAYTGKWTADQNSVNCTYELTGVKNQHPFYQSTNDGDCKKYKEPLEFYHNSTMWVIEDTNYSNSIETLRMKSLESSKTVYPWSNQENYSMEHYQSKAKNTFKNTYVKDENISITADY